MNGAPAEAVARVAVRAGLSIAVPTDFVAPVSRGEEQRVYSFSSRASTSTSTLVVFFSEKSFAIPSTCAPRYQAGVASIGVLRDDCTKAPWGHHSPAVGGCRSALF